MLGVGGSAFDVDARLEWLNLFFPEHHKPGMNTFGLSIESGKIVHQINNSMQIEVCFE